MDLELTDRVAIVTGGSKGIGKAVALELAREGVDVAICARNRDVLEEAAREVAEEDGPPRNPSAGRHHQPRVCGGHGGGYGRDPGQGVDILVNNAAVPGGLVQGPLADSSEEALLEDIDTKVVGYFRCARAVAPHMQRQQWGRIVNIGGLSGRRGGNISGLRNAAIAHLTKSLSEQLGPFGINVNLVHPGTTRTERSGPAYEEQARQQGVTTEEVERRIAQNIAIRRIVDGREIGYVVAFLASPKSTCITGEIMAAGGGSDRAFFQ